MRSLVWHWKVSIAHARRLNWSVQSAHAHLKAYKNYTACMDTLRQPIRTKWGRTFYMLNQKNPTRTGLVPVGHLIIRLSGPAWKDLSSYRVIYYFPVWKVSHKKARPVQKMCSPRGRIP